MPWALVRLVPVKPACEGNVVRQTSHSDFARAISNANPHIAVWPRIDPDAVAIPGRDTALKARGLLVGQRCGSFGAWA